MKMNFLCLKWLLSHPWFEVVKTLCSVMGENLSMVLKDDRYGA